MQEENEQIEQEAAGKANSLSVEELRDIEDVRNSLVDKLTIMAERMNLGKLTLHTAISYVDRLVILSHEKYTG